MPNRIIPVVALALALVACGGAGDSTNADTASPPVKNAALPGTTVPRRPPPTTMPPRAITPSTTTTKPTKPTKATTTTAKSTKVTTTATPTTTTAPATAGTKACTAQGPCTVGQTGPAGGIVFYVAPTPQPWGQYMEVRPEAFEQIVAETCNLEAYDSYAAGRIGDGTTQTAAVIAACAKDGKPAAAGSYGRVAAHVQNGIGGWFIPSKDELQALIDSKVVTFATDRDLTSGTWVNRPAAADSRGFDVLYGLKKEVLAGTAPSSRGGTVRVVEAMSDGAQSSGNPNNRWGWIHIARAFGPKA